LLLISSFIVSAMSKSVADLAEGDGALGGGAFEIDLRTANDFAFEGDILAFKFEGERGISGDAAALDMLTGAIVNARSSITIYPLSLAVVPSCLMCK
jgi:hypothetical protein